MSATNQPTYYGPVQQGGSQSTAINAQTKGSLACCVQQPGKFKVDGNDPQLNEVWKCPTSEVIKTDRSGIYTIYGQKFAIGQKRPQLEGNARFVSRFEAPYPPLSCEWVVNGIDVRQLEAGDHSEVRITYRAKYDDGLETISSTYLVEGDHWDLEWKPMNASVLAYCKNEANAVPTWVRYVPNANNDVLKPQGRPLQTATAQYVKECAGRSNFNTKWGQLGTTEWVRNQSVYKLNAHEEEIFYYYINNINPVLHTPVLTHTITTKHLKNDSTWRTITGQVKHVPYSDKVAGKIDEVLKQNQLSGCPYDFEKEWEWLVTGDKMTETNREQYTIYQRTIEYTGAKAWCGDFYKGGTWKLGGRNPPANPWEIGGR